MLSFEDNERVKTLPKWAQEIIKKLQAANEPMIDEVAKSRRAASMCKVTCDRLRDANAALMELLSCAGKNGIDWAKKVVEVLEGYAIFKEGTSNEAQ